MERVNNYDNNSIEVLEGPDQVRKRPSVVFGSNDVKAAEHAIFEIIANSVDEAGEGYGREIVIKVSDDLEVTVRDFGRGVPMTWNDKQKKYNWELIFCQMYASGKYNSSNYKRSLGLNGLGATATQYSSEYMEVTSWRDGMKYEMSFAKGVPVGKLRETKDTASLSGTEVRFKLDTEVFMGTDVSLESFIDNLRRQALQFAGLKFILHYKDRRELVLVYEEGIKGFIKDNCERPLFDGNIIYAKGTAHGRDKASLPEYDLDMEVAISFTRELSYIEMYHNGGYLKDFSDNITSLALASMITKVIEEQGKSLELMSKNEKIQFKDVEELVVAIGITGCPGDLTFFKHQTKTAITNEFIGSAYASFVYETFNRWAYENKESMKRIVNEVLINKTAREQSDAVKKKVIKKLSGGGSDWGNKQTKLKECNSRDTDVNEIYIVEGDSAATSCVEARDSAFQAIFPVRGKIMNCSKADLSKILNSDIITDLLAVLGCGIEAKSKHIKELDKLKFNKDKLRYGKIILCTDADLDGAQIRCLLLTVFYRLTPTLLEEGRVFIAETPLFEIVVKGKSYLAFDDKEKSDIIQKLHSEGIKDSQIKVLRSKGLGENDAEMMHRSTMNPETRRLIPIEYDPTDTDCHKLMASLLGDDIEGRRLLVEEYFTTSWDID